MLWDASRKKYSGTAAMSASRNCCSTFTSKIGKTDGLSAMKWFCLRSQPKHEHIAAGYLQKDADLEVYLPRIRFRRVTRRGAVWVTEALFPNYLFARFDWQSSFRQVQAARGVQTIVHFGNRWPTLADETIEELRSLLGEAEIHIIPEKLEKGDAVRIVEGPLQGLQAVVSQAL